MRGLYRARDAATPSSSVLRERPALTEHAPVQPADRVLPRAPVWHGVAGLDALRRAHGRDPREIQGPTTPPASGPRQRRAPAGQPRPGLREIWTAPEGAESGLE
jgi:hypothetical protein